VLILVDDDYPSVQMTVYQCMLYTGCT